MPRLVTIIQYDPNNQIIQKKRYVELVRDQEGCFYYAVLNPSNPTIYDAYHDFRFLCGNIINLTSIPAFLPQQPKIGDPLPSTLQYKLVIINSSPGYAKQQHKQSCPPGQRPIQAQAPVSYQFKAKRKHPVLAYHQQQPRPAANIPRVHCQAYPRTNNIVWLYYNYTAPLMRHTPSAVPVPAQFAGSLVPQLPARPREAYPQ